MVNEKPSVAAGICGIATVALVIATGLVIRTQAAMDSHLAALQKLTGKMPDVVHVPEKLCACSPTCKCCPCKPIGESK